MKYLLDSCVVIDICHTDPTILALLPRLGPPLFVTELSEELEDLKNVSPQEIRLKYLDADFEDIAFANDHKRASPLSWEDWVCLKTAARHGLTLITNDQRLRKECQRENVPTQYESYLIFSLFQAGILSRKEAETYIRAVCETNSFITEAVKQEALNQLAKLDVIK